MAGTPKPIRHGTIGGYVTHRRRGQDPCESCKQAWRLYYQRRNGSKPLAIHNAQKARMARLRRCINGHKDQWYIKPGSNGVDGRYCKACKRESTRKAAERSAREETREDPPTTE